MYDNLRSLLLGLTPVNANLSIWLLCLVIHRMLFLGNDWYWHACRRQQLHERDIVNQLQLSNFAKSKIQQSAQIHGQKFSLAMQGVDSTISQQLQHMIAS